MKQYKKGINESMELKMDGRGRILIPSYIRYRYNLREHDILCLKLVGKH